MAQFVSRRRWPGLVSGNLTLGRARKWADDVTPARRPRNDFATCRTGAQGLPVLKPSWLCTVDTVEAGVAWFLTARPAV